MITRHGIDKNGTEKKNIRFMNAIFFSTFKKTNKLQVTGYTPQLTEHSRHLQEQIDRERNIQVPARP